MASFAESIDDMDDAIMATLNDGLADYSDPQSAVHVVELQVLIDHNLQRVGSDGLFRSDAVGITWKKRDLSSATRGGFFQHGSKRYKVEDVIEDDGHLFSAACMEVR